jgi:FkbM family methyltransferase
MTKSELVLAITRRFPAVGRGLVWLWVRGEQALGRNPKEHPHWLRDQMVDILQYRVPIMAKLGNGMKVKVHLQDHVGGYIIRYGYYEPEEVALVQSLLGPGMNFIDIGAHIGQYALVGSEQVGPEGRVHAFEPDPETFSWFASNVERNHLRNVVMNQMALSSEPGVLDFYISKVNDIGSNSLREPRRFSGQVHKVECVLLDDYVRDQGIDQVHLIKMDVEGAEHSVFEGAHELLSSPNRPILMVEFEETRQKVFGYSCEKLAADLEGHGYTLFMIEDGRLIPHRLNPDLYSYNVMAVPSDRVDEVRPFMKD